jgi:hypothetical protein
LAKILAAQKVTSTMPAISAIQIPGLRIFISLVLLLGY